MGGLSIGHWLVFLLIVAMVFGTGKLKNIGKDLGSAVKGFKEGLHEGEEHPLKPDNADQARVTHQPTATQDNTIDVQGTTKP